MAVIIMARDFDIAESRAFGGGQYGVRVRNCTPVREEVALLVVRPWIITECEVAVDITDKFEFATGNRRRMLEIIYAVVDKRNAFGTDESAGGSGWRTYT